MGERTIHIQKIPIVISFLLFMQFASFAAEDSLTKKQLNISGFPIVYYTPETRWAFGVAGVTTFHFPSDSLGTQPSTFQLGFAYTQNKQVLLYLPYRLYFENANYLAFGELGYYKYNYFFFGIGNNHPDDFSEKYGVNYPRVRLNMLKRIYSKTYIGIKYSLDDFKITERENNGQLINGIITGSNGGINSGMGPIFLYDIRDNILYPSSGFYSELSVNYFNKNIGSDFNYLRFTIDAHKYFSISKQQILALNLFSESISGSPPFNQLATIGGTKRMRGYYEGRYRDKNVFILQAEYRIHLFRRFGATAFADYGGVSNKNENYSFTDFKYTLGGGIRFLLNKKEKLNLRLDAAFGEGISGYYLTIGEAF